MLLASVLLTSTLRSCHFGSHNSSNLGLKSIAASMRVHGMNPSFHAFVVLSYVQPSGMYFLVVLATGSILDSEVA